MTEAHAESTDASQRATSCYDGLNSQIAHDINGLRTTLSAVTGFNQLTANISVRDFPLMNALIEASIDYGGTISAYIVDRRSFPTTGTNNQVTFGDVTFQISGYGSATNGAYSFSGTRALNDFYNFNPCDWGSRTRSAEFFTRFGNSLPGVDYPIQFVGDRPIRETGGGG